MKNRTLSAYKADNKTGSWDATLFIDSVLQLDCADFFWVLGGLEHRFMS